MGSKLGTKTNSVPTVESNEQSPKNAGKTGGKLREVQSKYMQFGRSGGKTRTQSQAEAGREDVPMSLTSVSMQADHLRPKNAPGTHVVVARAAGAFRSTLPSRVNEGTSMTKGITTVEMKGKEVRMSRIHSALFIGKKQLLRPFRSHVSSTLPQPSPTLNRSPL